MLSGAYSHALRVHERTMTESGRLFRRGTAWDARDG